MPIRLVLFQFLLQNIEMKLILLLIESCFALKVYDSNFPNETFWGISGLHFLKEDLSVELSGSLTFCVRFRFERFDWNSVLWDIRKPNDWVKFFQLRTEYRKTLAYFGNFWGPAQSICTIKDLKTEEFNIWRPTRWHHVCYAYDKYVSHIALIKVRLSLQSKFQVHEIGN